MMPSSSLEFVCSVAVSIKSRYIMNTVFFARSDPVALDLRITIRAMLEDRSAISEQRAWFGKC